MRYSILVVINVVDRDVVLGASWSLMRRQNSIPGLWIHTVGLAWVSDRELRHVASFTEAEVSSVQVGLLILSGASAILEGLECLVQLVNTDTTHLRLLVQELAFKHWR